MQCSRPVLWPELPNFMVQSNYVIFLKSGYEVTVQSCYSPRILLHISLLLTTITPKCSYFKSYTTLTERQKRQNRWCTSKFTSAWVFNSISGKRAWHHKSEMDKRPATAIPRKPLWSKTSTTIYRGGIQSKPHLQNHPPSSVLYFYCISIAVLSFEPIKARLFWTITFNTACKSL